MSAEFETPNRRTEASPGKDDAGTQSANQNLSLAFAITLLMSLAVLAAILLVR